MMWILGTLLVALSLTHLTVARCNSKIVGKIKELNLNNEKILDKLDGEYRFVFFSIGRQNGKSKGPCVKLRFLKEEGKPKVEYVGVMNGKYALEVVDGVLQQTGAQGKVDMLAHIVANGPDVIALYTCSTTNRPAEPTLTFVAVSTKAENAKEKYLKVREALANVGIKNGVEMPACLDSDGEPVGEGNTSENAFSNAMGNVDNEVVEDDDNVNDDDDEEEEAAESKERQHEMALLKDKEEEEHHKEEKEED